MTRRSKSSSVDPPSTTNTSATSIDDQEEWLELVHDLHRHICNYLALVVKITLPNNSNNAGGDATTPVSSRKKLVIIQFGLVFCLV